MINLEIKCAQYSGHYRSEVTCAISDNLAAYNFAYNFDNIGNRLTSRLVQNTAYTSNNLNQYTGITTDNNTFTPTYDNDGNMLTLPGNSKLWTLNWNTENRLQSIVSNDSSLKLEFVYDYMGRRVEKKVYTGSAATNWTVSKTERFVYDEFKQIEKFDSNNNNAIVQKFTWQPEKVSLGVPLAVYDAAASTNYYYPIDANKNIGPLADASGNLVAQYEYSPFGELAVKKNGAYVDTNTFRFIEMMIGISGKEQPQVN